MCQRAKSEKKVVIAFPSIGEEHYSEEMIQTMLDMCINALKRAGAEIRLLDFNDDVTEVAADCDGLLIPGGSDVDPSCYARPRNPKCGDPCPKRDAFEIPLVKAFLELDKPILCICRGNQVLNVANGGTIIQNAIPEPDYDEIDLADGKFPTHVVRFIPGTHLADIMGVETHVTSTGHHQAVENLGENIIAAAYVDEGIETGLVEGIERSDKKFCIGVQFHPEFYAEADPVQQGLFDAFVKACY